MELNIPRSGSGLTMQWRGGKPRRRNSAASGLSAGRQTSAISRAPSARHWAKRWPMTEVWPHRRSSLGCPIRAEAPAPRMATPIAAFDPDGFLLSFA